MSGRIPVGMWRLNIDRSRTLSPKSMTLWIVKNSGDELTWVGVETNAQQQMQVVSWSGRFAGPPAVVMGAGIEARLTCSPDEGIRTEGEFPGLGPFVEFCRLTDDGKRMICEGHVTTPNGVQTYLEDFEWFGPSPHQPGPSV